MPSNTKQNSNKNNYYLWQLSAMIIVFIIALALVWKGYALSQKAMSAINTSNQKIVEKTGIEITTDLDEKKLNNVRQIIEAKETDRTLRNNIRNIFQYDQYAYFFTEMNDSDESINYEQ